MLEQADLIARTRRGQQLVCRLNPKGLKSAQDWLEEMRAFWEGSFDRLDKHLRNTQPPKEKS